MKVKRLLGTLWCFGVGFGSFGCVSSHTLSSDRLDATDSLSGFEEDLDQLKENDQEDVREDMSALESFGTNDPRKATIIKADLVRLLVESGFPRESVPKMVCTAKFESNFRLMATNLNRNGTRDSGIFQINDVWLNTCKLSREELMKPDANARCAFTVYKKQGLNAWVAYKKKRSYCQKYKLEPSLAALLPTIGQKPSI
jgi:hypothetical protein